MYFIRQTHENWQLLGSIFLSGRIIEPNVKSAFFHYHQEVDYQSVTQFTLNDSRNRPTMTYYLFEMKIYQY